MSRAKSLTKPVSKANQRIDWVNYVSNRGYELNIVAAFILNLLPSGLLQKPKQGPTMYPSIPY